MNQISTLSELLQLSNSSYRIFDMGRTVSKLSKQTFEKVEQAMQPYPFPIQGHACIAIVFWQKNIETPYLWFVKIPLDERGLLNQAARNHFIAIIMEALGQDLSQDPTEKQEELLKGNPYLFKPTQYKLAALNSIIKRDLKQKASQYYEHSQLYISGKLGFESWQGVGVQGLCDFASRINEPENSKSLINAYNKLPTQVFTPLCSALENQKLPIDLLSFIVNNAEKIMSANTVDEEKLANTLRSIAANADNPLVKALIENILNSAETADLNVLLTISGRCWPALADLTMMMAFLEKIVSIVEQDVFVSVFQDLIALPDIRPTLLQCIRSPQRSDILASAFGQLFSQVKGK